MFIFICSDMEIFIFVSPFPLISKGDNMLVHPLPLMSKEESILVLLVISNSFYNLQ